MYPTQDTSSSMESVRVKHEEEEDIEIIVRNLEERNASIKKLSNMFPQEHRS